MRLLLVPLSPLLKALIAIIIPSDKRDIDDLKKSSTAPTIREPNTSYVFVLEV